MPGVPGWGRQRVTLAAAIAAAVCAGFIVGSAGSTASRAAAFSRPGPRPVGLVVDERRNPLDVAGRPRFGWLPRALDSNERQSAYEVVVRDRLTGHPVWDSGHVRSSRQSSIRYAGPRLAPGHSYRWRVITWDKHGRMSRRSGPAR